MARLYLFAEGQTEQTFAHSVLIPHLANFGVYLHPPVLIAHARKKGKTHRGGGRNFQPMQNDIVRMLKQDSGGDVHFTTMIDLYALHADFPGLSQSFRLESHPHVRVKSLQDSWFQVTNDPRFIPFIQLHEFEAVLFSDIDRLEQFFENCHSRVLALKRSVQGIDGPELINDGQHTAPSKRIIAKFPEYDGAKPTVGPQMAEQIGLTKIRAACPHFDEWITRLEQLGQS